MRFTVPLPGPERTIHISLTEGGALATLCVAAAGVVALLTDLGEDADLSYYATVAQVIPIFLLALMVEIRARLDVPFARARKSIEENDRDLRHLLEIERIVRERGATGEDLDRASKQLRDAAQQTSEIRSDFLESLPAVQRTIRAYVVVAVPGEAACLVALAGGHGTTFALMLAALSVAAMVALYVRSLGRHYEWPQPHD